MELGDSSSAEASQQSNHGSTSEMEENSTTLLNLPPICLDHILKHRDLDDLTNTANSHSALTASAIRVFDAHVKHKPIVLYRSRSRIDCFKHYYRRVLGPAVQLVRNNSLFSSILNHFGPKMESLHIHIEHRFILDKVIEKCAPNLTKLHVSLNQNDLHLNNRFPKLHELAIRANRKIPNSWSKFNEHFPELRCLNIHNSIAEGFEFEETLLDHIPNLTRFGFTTLPGKASAPQLRRVGEFVNANKHINSLKLCARSTAIDSIQASINWEELKIANLHLSIPYSYLTGTFRHIEQLRQLRTLRIACNVENFEILDLNQLEELDFDFEGQTVVDFYTNCNNLKKLTVRYSTVRSGSSTSFEWINGTLPQLKVVTLIFKRMDHIKTDILIIITVISALMRQRRSLHSIEVIVRREIVDWSLIQNDNWELKLAQNEYNFETARFQNRKIRNA